MRGLYENSFIMTSCFNNFVGLSICALFLGSCATHQTPISRELNTIRETPIEEPKHTLSNKVSSQWSFDWPVDKARFTRGFLPKTKKKKRPHYGIDLASNKGTPILSSRRGTVIYAGKHFSGYGKMVLVESEDSWATIYAHLDKILVAEGQVLHQGEIIGTMGRTGRATGVHLHFEIRKDKKAVDPLPLLPNGHRVASN